MSTAVPVTRVSQSRLTEALRETSEFGTTFSDHMLVADWEAGSWKPPQIVPFGPISFSPALTPFHYAQAIFEAFKAHRNANGAAALFRPRLPRRHRRQQGRGQLRRWTPRRASRPGKRFSQRALA